MTKPKLKYYKPSPELRKYIRFYLDADFDEGQFLANPTVNYPTVFPAVNLVYSRLANDYKVGNNIYRKPRFFAGGLTHTSAKFLSYNKSSLISVFFYPTGFQHIFDYSLYSMANCFTLMESIDPVNSGDILGEVRSEPSDEKRIAKLDSYFLDRLKSSDWNKPYLDRVADLVLHSHANIKIKSITEKLGINERTLRRNFQKDMGMTLKEFIDITRINFASIHLTKNPGKSTQKMVHELGYFDQSHFLKHLRKYLGISSSSFEALSKTFLYFYSDIELSNPVS